MRGADGRPSNGRGRHARRRRTTVQRRRAPARPGADPAQTGRRSGTNTGATRTGRPPGRPVKLIGGDLLSQAREGQVPSALRGLTALFGMGRGVSPSPKPPENGEKPSSGGPSKLHRATLTGIKNIRQALVPLVPVSFAPHGTSRS